MNKKGEYQPALKVAGALGISTRSLKKLADRGVIGVFQLPGMAARYSMRDAKRLLAEAERPALAVGK